MIVLLLCQIFFKVSKHKNKLNNSDTYTAIPTAANFEKLVLLLCRCFNAELTCNFSPAWD